MPDTDQEQLPAKRVKSIYIGAPACFALEQGARHILDAFGSDDDCYSGMYLVGSCLERPDWRDVDVRFMMGDEAFACLFPDAHQHWEHDARWLLLTVAISKWLSDQTGLPIDFQFQPQTHANKLHKKARSAIGLRMARL